MILYELQCPEDHRFEAWFKDSGSFDEQVEHGEVSCPYCGATDVTKAPMAPRIAKGRKNNETMVSVEAGDGPLPTAYIGASDQMQMTQQVIKKLRNYVEENCENVGKRFAEEALRIHHGEAEERAIYGEATNEEVEELLDEGVDIQPLPWSKRKDA